MKEYTKWDAIKDFFMAPWNSLEYWFAKRWLDKNFGKQEFWGDFLADKIYAEDYKRLNIRTGECE